MTRAESRLEHPALRTRVTRDGVRASVPARVWRDPWNGIVLLCVLALLVAARGVPLGEPVADDFDFLHETLFRQPIDWLAGGGMPLYWRPLSRQLYYLLIAPFAVTQPWAVVALQAFLLAVAGVLLMRALRPSWPAWAAAAAGTVPVALEAARELVTWSSAAQDLLALVFGMAMLHALTRGRPSLALLWLALAFLCKESSLTFAVAAPFWPLLRTRDGRPASLRDRVWTACRIALVTGAWWGLHEWVSRRAGLLPPPHGSGDAVGLPARLAWAAKGLVLESVSGRHPGAATWTAWAIAIVLVACAVAVMARGRQREPDQQGPWIWLAWAAVWTGSAMLPLAWFMPAWGCHRAVMPALGLVVTSIALLRPLGPWPVGAFAGLRLVALLAGAPVPARIPAAGTYAEFDFDRLGSLQKLAHEIRTRSLRATPTLPGDARIIRYQWPRMSDLAFEGSKAFQVWYRDSTVRVVGQSELDRPPFGHADLAIAFEPLRTPQVAIISPAALKSVWEARRAITERPDAAEAMLAGFESQQADTNAAGFIATGLALRGAALLAQDRLDSAATTLERALRWNAADPNAHRLLAEFHRRRGRPDLQMLELQRQLEIAPDDSMSRTELYELQTRARQPR